MKKQISDLLIIIVFFTMIFLKDYSLQKASKIDVIENSFDTILNYKLSDYESLKRINSIKSSYNYKCVTSIKNRNLNDFYKYIILYKSNCNIKSGDLVLNQYGLIGVVNDITKKSIKVLLVTNPQLKTSVRINKEYGTLNNKNGYLVIEDITSIKDIKYGDIVYTSGLTAVPGNIKIGEVSEIRKNIIFVKENKILNNNPYVLIIGDNL